MKKLYQYTMILLAGVVGACSSLDVNDPYSENLPSDFSVSTYMQMYPRLRKYQIKDYVKARNVIVEDSLNQQKAKVKAMLEQQGFAAEIVKDSLIKLGLDYNAIKTQDEANFKANTAALVEICKNPFLGSYPEASCANPAADATIMKDLAGFNFINVADDFAILSNNNVTIPVDSVAISQQYIVFGRNHGWAYRWCVSEADLAGPVRDPAIEAAQATPVDDPEKFVADPGIYCKEQLTGILHKVNP